MSADMWNYLPQDMANIIVEFISDIDTFGYLHMVSVHWPIKPNEMAYRNMCILIYSSQSLKKGINIDKWGGAKQMLINRPRLRTNGFYSLKTTYSRPPVNDAFWEEKHREFNEVKFYRHIRFFSDGRALYSLCNKSPAEISSDLDNTRGNNPAKRLHFGTYTLQRDRVTVDVHVGYAEIRLALLLLHLCGEEEGGFDEQYAGRHNLLKLVEHSSRAVEQNPTADPLPRVPHTLPVYCNFLFHRRLKWDEWKHSSESLTCAL